MKLSSQRDCDREVHLHNGALNLEWEIIKLCFSHIADVTCFQGGDAALSHNHILLLLRRNVLLATHECRCIACKVCCMCCLSFETVCVILDVPLCSFIAVPLKLEHSSVVFGICCAFYFAVKIQIKECRNYQLQ